MQQKLETSSTTTLLEATHLRWWSSCMLLQLGGRSTAATKAWRTRQNIVLEQV